MRIFWVTDDYDDDDDGRQPYRPTGGIQQVTTTSRQLDGRGRGSLNALTGYRWVSALPQLPGPRRREALWDRFGRPPLPRYNAPRGRSLVATRWRPTGAEHTPPAS